MSFDIAKTAALQTLFIQFRNPATDAKLYAPVMEGDEPKRDEHGNVVFDMSKPVGVRVYTPGSLQYRNAESAITTENIKRGKKALTGDTLQGNAVELLANTTIEFINMNYHGESSGVETFRKFYGDVGMVAYREQVQEKQGDVGNAYASTATV